MSENLRPLSFEKLMGLLIEEHNATGTIFGVKDFYKAGRARLPIFGMRIENPVGPAAAKEEQTFLVQMTAELLGYNSGKTVDTQSEIRIAAGHVVVADLAQIDHSD